jgi:GT2 family glycosyltransferase
MSTQSRVGIILVDYHGEKDTLACLDSLAKLKTKYIIQIYVVQPEAQESKIESHFLKPHLIKEKANLGFSWANNLGMKQAIKDNCDICLILNNDTVVDSHFLDPLVEGLQDDMVGMVSPKIYFAPNREYHHDDYKEAERGKVIWFAGGVIDWANVDAYHWGVDEVDHGQFDTLSATDFNTGCALGITRKTIEKIGFMDEKYFLYLEDVDWSVRAKRQGYQLKFVPQSFIWHKNAGSTSGPGSIMHQYYLTRNRIGFANKYSSFRTKLALLKQSISQWQNANFPIKQAVVDAYLNRYGKTSIKLTNK